MPATAFTYQTATLHHVDAFEYLETCESCSLHAVVTDPPYGLVEYQPDQVAKLREGHGGVWRIPPSYDGCKRSPLPRFTTLTHKDMETMSRFFEQLAHALTRVLVPGANVLVASNPLVVHVVTSALQAGGLEPRGQLIRLVQTLRGGDRPKNAEDAYRDVSVMPRSQWEPWIMMRKPIEGTVAHNLETYGTGGWRRVSDAQPFGDVIKSAPTRKEERAIAPHPSLKPQALMRQLVRASLPMGTGIILDPFAGAGSTLAAACHEGLQCVGCEVDVEYFATAQAAIPELARLHT